jgi:hypothetical protein
MANGDGGDTNSTVGNANGSSTTSAIQGSIDAGQTTDVSDPSVAPPAPAQKPSYFKNIIGALGLALAQGAKAGVQAPMSPQGPAIAAQTAIEAPQKELEQKQKNKAAMTSQQQADLTVAMTQLKLHQLHTMVLKEDEDIQNAAYNKSRDTLEEFIDKGRVDVIATGDIAAVQAEFNKRQADAHAAGNGLQPLQIFSAPGSSAGKPQFALVNMEKGKLSEALKDETWGASDFSDSPDTQKDYQAAGIGEFKYKGATAGTDQQKALNDRAASYRLWWTQSAIKLSNWRKLQEQQKGANARAKEAGDVRMKVAELNNSTRRAVAAAKGANDQTDKELISASKGLVAANKALGDAQGKIGNKAWSTLGGGDAREIATKRRARDQAQAVFDGILAKKTAGKGIEDMNKPAAVPKGTLATKPIAQQYLQKAGGDVAKARKMLTDDGYVIPKVK